MDGKVMVWASAKEGRKSMAWQGSREVDIYAGFFDQDLYDRYKLNKDDFALLKEKEEKEKTEKDKADKEKAILKAKTPNKLFVKEPLPLFDDYKFKYKDHDPL
jgi:hypothetical protein